jgi:hypothetical protein
MEQDRGAWGPWREAAGDSAEIPVLHAGRWPADARSSGGAADGAGATSITPRGFPDGSAGVSQPVMSVTP